ncbi:NupC/NupG family nucleoside CNT transporter [Halochromatium roseum]|uniref:NupC/NupG family nucleoside CNT transporter n=1 Tax=Halochromatium roseum TaxID=391920 RepID=UPI001912059C|nr:nucleoside transporter C-terminal domain-containing protein [Halochromatium roseum]MBK5940113.1 nucleoside:proton symporter [Halochromatium roseum]
MTIAVGQLLQGTLGVAVLLLLAWLVSENRRRISARVVITGLGLQIALAALLLGLPQMRSVFIAVNGVVVGLQQATEAGTGFVFGYLGGGPAPFDLVEPANSFILAFRALPLILVIGALSALLFHWRVLPVVVNALAWLLRRSLGISGALGLGTAANIFMGMIEAPLMIKPYLKAMNRGELFALMTTGMATIAGTVMILYASLISEAIPNALGNILTASLISAPAALLIAEILVPSHPRASATTPLPEIEIRSEGAMDAVTRGTLDAIPLLLNIIAMLIVMVALVTLANELLAFLPPAAGAPLTLERILGWLFAPVVWLIGIPWHEAATAGALMGTKTVLNELLAYIALADLPPQALSERSRLIMTYALCGFANLGSLGIMLGGLGSMVPERRPEIAALGFKAILAGTLATLMTGAIAGLMLTLLGS